jgi:hypothetical protein
MANIRSIADHRRRDEDRRAVEVRERVIEDFLGEEADEGRQAAHGDGGEASPPQR